MRDEDRNKDDDESKDAADVAAEATTTAADAGLGERPAEDALVLEVVRARIGNALFATEHRVRFGRYQLLERAGAGGMGVVWSAWDPELERRVAIKLMHVKSATARASMLREGQSLAKLSHPNIVPIYDVGSLDDQVYLVMEWIAGVTLRAYCAAPHSTRELLAIFLAAGAGVAAAHRAGIVQRDFKPDNVMIGSDGRVRLLDFGLARPEHSAGSIAGTPRYMAPEQAQGAAPTPAADQYSFGVALGEALATRRDRPAAVATVIARATAEAPGARYPDMDTLLAALARDPARMWRRRGLVASMLVAGAAAAFAIGRQQGDDAQVCSGAASALAQVWNPARSAALVGHVQTLGPYGAAQAPRLAGQLAAHGATWIDARRGACLANHRREITPSLYERGLACLERSRAALDSVATTLTRAALDRLPDAILAARNVPDARHCLAAAITDAVVPPRPELAARVSALGAEATKARYLALAADPAALALARSTALAATQLAYPPLVAQAQLALGAALEAQPSTATETIDAYGVAADAALLGGDDITFVEAFARRLFVAAKWRDARAAELASALPFVTTIARRTSDAGRFARTLLFNNAATERLAVGDTPGAIAWLRKARSEPAPAERGVELWAVLGNLAMLVPDRAEREALFAEERAQLERTLGADHPFTLQIRLRAAMFVESSADAFERLRELCATYVRLHPDRHDKIASCHAELGWLAVERGDANEATRAYAITAAQPSDHAARSTTARAELRRLAGDPRAAIALAEPLARAQASGAAWWEWTAAAEAWLSVAAAREALDDRAGMVAALRAARALLAGALRHTQVTAVLRRRTRVDALLAVATHDRALADQAIAWYRVAGGYEAAVRALEACRTTPTSSACRDVFFSIGLSP